jgi:uncharacterized membrane protein YfcA
MPLLTLVLGLPTATPLVALVMLATICGLLWGTRRDIDLRAAWQLVLWSALGMPLGLLLVREAPERAVRGLLGIVLVGFSLYNLARPRLPTLRGGAWLVPFGLAAGILGGAYNTNGPPVVLYGALRHWPAHRFRATLQGYFLPAALLICAGHAAAGLWSLEIFRLFALALPAVGLAIVLGIRLSRRIPAERFGRVLYASLVALGLLLLV